MNVRDVIISKYENVEIDESVYDVSLNGGSVLPESKDNV
jgi:hypothetical protein